MAEAAETTTTEAPITTVSDDPGDVSHETETEVVETTQVTDEGKPGGDDPQAVRARKEYAARKRAEQQADATHQENIRLSERLKVIEEERRRAPAQPAQKVYTIAELNAAVDAGNIARAEADRYVEEIIIPRRTAQVVEQREANLASRLPMVKAVEQINEYRKYLPFLNDKSSPEFQRIATQYGELVGQGLPNNEVTEALAVKLLHGNLETHRKKAELAQANATVRAMPSDAGGGGATRTTNGKVDVTKAPAHLQQYWERTGTLPADREKEMSYWAKNQQKRK